MTKADLVPATLVERRILSIRGHKVIIDADLAALYGVETRRLNEQVTRNSERFPNDFVFQVTPDESDNLRSQSATSSSKHGGRRLPPYAFTEHGALMVANVLEALWSIIATIRQLMAPAARTAKIGFEAGNTGKRSRRVEPLESHPEDGQ